MKEIDKWYDVKVVSLVPFWMNLAPGLFLVQVSLVAPYGYGPVLKKVWVRRTSLVLDRHLSLSTIPSTSASSTFGILTNLAILCPSVSWIFCVFLGAAFNSINRVFLPINLKFVKNSFRQINMTSISKSYKVYQNITEFVTKWNPLFIRPS